MAKEEQEVKAPILPLSVASLVVIGLLLALLIAEFLVAQFTTPRWLILIFAFVQGAIVLWEYMHVKRAFGRGETGKEES